MTTPERRTVIVERDVDSVALATAELIAQRAFLSIRERRRFNIALSGGHFAAKPYALLALSSEVDWSRVHIFWGDERMVSRDNQYSNFKVASESLIERVPNLPPANIHAVPTESTTPAAAALRYSEMLMSHFDIHSGQFPVFDLMHNGMGSDGHTASLFPYHPSLHEAGQACVSTHAGLQPWVDRVTLTIPVFNNARCVVITVVGADKAETLKTVLSSPQDRDQKPVSAIQPATGDLIWIVDKAAAG